MTLLVAFWFAFAWFLGGFVNGITGFGAALAAMPVVLLGMDITLAVPACSLMTWVVSLEQGWRYKGYTDWQRILPVLVGALPGAVAGFLVLRHMSPQHLKAALGIFLTLYAVWGLFLEGGKTYVIARVWGYVAGFLSTLFGSAFSFNGPPLAVYASLSGWGKIASKAGLAMCFIGTSSLMVVAQIFAGAHSLVTFQAMCLGTPAALLGAWVGFRVSRNMSDIFYRKLFFGFIAGTGLNFFWQARDVFFALLR